MKKKVLFTSIVMLLICIMTVCASAEYSGTCGYNLTWVLDDEGTLTISGTGAMPNWSYSSVPWYSYRSSIETVIIEDSVTSIGEYAFSNCTSLKDIDIPNSVTSIGYRAFYNCTSLANVSIENGVISIGEWAFYGCTSLESIEIPDSVTSIGGYAFYNCTNLVNVELSDSVTKIEVQTFHNCTRLKSILIPNSVTLISPYVFGNCESLASIEIPTSVTSIGYRAFYNCTSLDSVSILNSEVEFDSEAFYGRSLDLVLYGYAGSTAETYSSINDITFVTIENFCGDTLIWTLDNSTLTIFGSGAMTNWNTYNSFAPWHSYNTSIKTVTIKNGVTSIGNYALFNCKTLATVVIPNSITLIGPYAFGNCENLKSATIFNREVIIDDDAFADCSPDLVLHGYAGSTTETYAKENGIKFVAIEEVSDKIEAKEAVVVQAWTGAKAPMFAVNFKIEAEEYGFIGTVRNENGITTGDFNINSANVVIAKVTDVDMEKDAVAVISGIPSNLQEEVTIAVRAYYVINGHYFYGPIVEKTLGVNWAE